MAIFFRCLLVFTFTCFGTTIYSQRNNVFRQIKEQRGIDSIRLRLKEVLVGQIIIFEKSHFLFFEVSLNKKGVESVEELYRQPDDVSNQALAGIQKAVTGWKGSKRKIERLIIPVFLIVDEKNSNHVVKIDTGKFELEYDFARKSIKGYLIPPIIFSVIID